MLLGKSVIRLELDIVCLNRTGLLFSFSCLNSFDLMLRIKDKLNASCSFSLRINYLCSNNLLQKALGHPVNSFTYSRNDWHPGRVIEHKGLIYLTVSFLEAI